MHITLRIFAIAVTLAFTMAMAPLASAGPENKALTSGATDFETNALDADGCFRLVHCSHAMQVDRGDVVKENYRCTFVDDALGFWGTPALPTSAMVWDYDSSMDLDGDDCPIDPLLGPYRWFSDIEAIQNPGVACFMYTHATGDGDTNSSWRMVITPSGNVNVTVVYDPPVFEGPDCP